MIKELLIRFKTLLRAFFRDVLIFLLFFATYSGFNAAFIEVRKAKVEIQKYLVPEKAKERRTRPRSKKEISRTV